MAISLVSCNDDDNTMEPVGATHGELTLEYDNVVGNRDLALDTDTYTNAANEPFTVSTFNYYVSNIKFYKADGSSYVVPQDSSYFLIRESDPSSQEITFKNVPVGDYTAVEFMVGVDSLRSVSDVSKRIGVLDPAYSEVMYWAWNSGYIFMKLEGESDVIDTPNGKYNFHIGLFGGYETKTLNNLKTVKVDFGEHKASVTGELSPQIHLLTDVEKIFSGSTTVSLAATPVVMTSDYSKNIAANYTSMFSLDHIHAD
ncbi:hypothetical protein CLV98_106132 [Dyadobacter jejuensis]|uniref:Copper-binding protein MbnP-like domain-containing protein n=2 Tax=Dyadobacter jejuensis TaxID=1082580 RepID=A0A316ALD8_9BACT|nr:hypothetical protein CLV98_106132 [Dyadobacter jejuensis]